MLKRFFDLTIGIVLIILFCPLFLLLSLAILITMGQPVFFRQLRPGYKERPFLLYKFRTMTNEKDSAGNDLPDEERLTALGKWLRKSSLDELAQLINVVKGEISFVGPRPLMIEYLPLYSKEQARRHEVKPGITGWAQVKGRNALTWEERFALDVWYVDNRSFWLDSKILALTVLTVIKSEGINQDGHVTMPKFKGNTNGYNSNR